MNTIYRIILRVAMEMITRLRLIRDEVTAHSRRGYGSLMTRLRLVVCMLVMLLAGAGNAWGVDYSGFWYLLSKQDTGYYLVPAADPQQNPPIDVFYDAYGGNSGPYSKPFLTTYQTNKDDNSIWMIEAVEGETDYYYIKHLVSGKCVVYGVVPGFTGDNTRRMFVHLEDSPVLDDYTKFKIVANGSNVVITPKKSSSLYLNVAGDNKPFYYGQITNGLYYGGIIGGYSQANDGSKWTLEEYQFIKPVFAYDKAHDGYTITHAIPDVKIYYKINGEPTISAADLYAKGSVIPISSLHENDVINAFTTIDNKDGYKSETASITIYKVATPETVVTSTGSIRIVCSTPGVAIYYTTDGTEPTATSARYSTPLTDVSGKVIKAIAVKDGWVPSDIGDSGSFQCATPVIRRGTNGTFTLECEFPATDVSIYYTTDGTTPTTASTLYAGPVSATFPVTVKAIAVADGYDNSAVAEKTITDDLDSETGYYLISSSGDFDLFVSMVNSDGASGNYRITDDFTVSNPAVITKEFTGVLDGGFHTITGLTHSLFDIINGGTVKNLMLKDVSVSTSDDFSGAICNRARGAAKIYNCGVLSGSVSGSKYVGGLVGLINNESSVRVVNCFNYASVSGGTMMAGIVGNNEGDVGNVRIAMCMMYGDMPGGTSPVYAGNHISNVSKFTEYNYYRSRANLTYETYNDQLAIDKDEYLTRFPFYRHILNTHRELAAYFLFGATNQEVRHISEEQIAEIGHWVLKTDVAPYPIIEEWKTNTKKTTEEIAYNLPSTNEERKGRLLVEVGSGGFLTVYLTINGRSYSTELPITDMNEDKYDYTWGKVVLPFAGEFEVNTDYSKVCTGWKITGVTGGTTGTYENYNVSDRDCTKKDLFSTTGFIFAQGGNYVVPYGVTAINIEANFANAFYLSDEAYEIAYSGDKGGNESGYIGRTSLGGSMPDTYHGQTVYHTLAGALSAMSASGSTHNQAVVLVGNYHQDSENVSNHTTKGLTIMSIDADNNQEPDYAWYSNNTQDRPAIPPTRFDFVALVPVGMSSRVNNSSYYPLIPIWKPRGWFEITETSLSMMDQFELDSGNFNTSDGDTRNYRCIINNGYFTQMVRSRATDCSKVKYYQIGGNAYVKEFYPGSHSNANKTTTLVPINVTGGEIEQCFMTGYGKGTATGSDIYFWCAGGKIDKFLGAYMENPKTSGVNMTAKIDHALIGRFFGGGTSPKAQITGDINVTINNSKVDFYCGGPEFGDMSDGKTVTTHATGTTFGEYYGAGFGGTAITYTNDEDKTDQGIGSSTKPTVDYPSGFFTSHFVGQRLKYKQDYGLGSCYKFEFLFNSRGHGSVARFYTGYARFSLATTGSVINILDDCILLHDFYGAGCQGKVNGTVSSTLTACTVNGSVFGGGYKAESNEVDVYPTTPPTMSVYTRETGIFSDFGTVAPETFTWAQGTAENNNKADGNILYTGTDVTLSELGNVTGAITINIDNGTTVAGSVFGGGNESKSLNNTNVNILDGALINNDVYGGGNKADVVGNTLVSLTGGTVSKDVYGGGRGTLKTATDEGVAPTVGDATVELNNGVEDNVRGCVVRGSIFGCNNLNGTPLGIPTVHVYATQQDGQTRITNPEEGEQTAKRQGTYDVTAVYGGGNLAAYVPTDLANGTTKVIIDGCDRTSINQVYGGGNAASTPATSVTVNGTYEIYELFGGGNGKDNINKGAGSIMNPGANVGFKDYWDYENNKDLEAYDTKEKRLASAEFISNYVYGSGNAAVNIFGGNIHRVFGGSNTRGNVRNSAVTLLDNNSDCDFNVEEAYGGGKSASMDAEAKLLMACIPGLKAVYGGAEAADINDNVTLNITNGTFSRVFGGNNQSGTIRGSITVNIEETGCKPVVIGELYGGGNLAPYSVYGYDADGTIIETGDTPSYDDPQINVKSFTSIGAIYGGGYGSTAILVGNPTVNINEVVGSPETYPTDGDDYDDTGFKGKTLTIEGHDVALPAHQKGKVGAIGDVFGGGNAAPVHGNTNVNVGTLQTIDYVTTVTGELTPRTAIPVVGADIRGNVYGGGNNAVVTGSTNVQIGY